MYLREEFTYILESQLLITQNVNKHLQSKIDDQEQYSRRPCLVVNGMKKPGNEDDENNDFEAVIETLAKESNQNPSAWKA